MGDRDRRFVCKYGLRCYQKNPIHHEKYQHPLKKPVQLNQQDNNDEQHIQKKIKLDDSLPTINKKIEDLATNSKEKPEDTSSIKVSNDISDSDSDSTPEETNILENPEESGSKEINKLDETKENESERNVSPKIIENKVAKKIISEDIDPKKFIETKFLVKMPPDFYQFWKLCQELKSNNPEMAFKDVELTLVGPYDVLGGKFSNVEDFQEDEYLRHWRYYYDPPEFQTVIKGSSSKGYHIGYFRDDPNEEPVFLASNYGAVDGTFEVMGSNIFAAISNYLEDFRTRCNPFQKINVEKYQTIIKTEAKKLGLDLDRSNSKIKERNRQVVTKGFNKIGIVVPYNKKTQLGYRELAMDNKDLKALLLKIKGASEEQKDKFISDLQPVLTCATLAIDECDFGTGIELGLNIHFCGVEALDKNISLSFLQNSYKLLNRSAFSKIAEAHLSSRKKGCNLSII